MRFYSAFALLSMALGFAACGRRPAAAPPSEKPVMFRESTAAAREAVSITVYNQNFGLVREVRTVPLGKGRVELRFQDVSAYVQPETVHLRGLGSPGALKLLEQNYRYDLLTPENLLAKHVGERVTVYRYNEALGTEERKEAEVLAVDGGTVLRIDGEVTFGELGRIAFPEVPTNLSAKPALVWALDSSVERERVEVSYLAGNLNWSTDYVLRLDADDRHGDLTGWVTLTNESGASYERAELKLVAGEVQRVSDLDQGPSVREEMMAEAAPPAQFQQESFFEYHLYSLGRPTDLMDQETKQVTLLEGRGVGIRKKLIFFGADHYYRGKHGQVASNQKVGVYLDIENTEKNQLGMPLPKGVLRVYKADKSGSSQFIGEDHIDHTPRDEKIRIKLGEAFDVVGERKQTEWRALGGCGGESAWEIQLRNHKDDAARVLVYEPLGGEWQIVQSSHRHRKEDARTLTFDVEVPERGQTKITYRVRVRWC